MSKSWYLMGSHSRVSGFENDDFSLFAQSGFDELLADSPESTDVLIDGITKRVIIQQSTKDGVLNILSRFGDYKAGDIVFNISNKLNFLVTQRPYFNKMYQRSKLEECNIDLRWVDENGSVHSQPSVLYSNIRSNIGIDEDKTMILPSSRRQVAAQYNQFTSKIKKEKRFIIGGEAFEVIDVDCVSDVGIVNLSLRSSGDINPVKDNLELGIADYYGNVADYQLAILNGDYISIEDKQTLQINIEIKNRSEVVNVSDELIFAIDDESKATISSTGLLTPVEKGLVKVSISFRDITKTLHVNITASTTNNYSCEIVGDDSIKYNMIKNFRSTVFNNGIERDDITNYWITDIDGSSPSSLASILEQDQILHTCKIKANNKKGSFLLHCQNRSKLAYKNKKIEIKSLI
ncbi:hypothetical protein IAQ67_16710 [Paenibacillus peoriae]|uniref:Ig-like domain-containing protein n=1 Tax=Paenibacillus peoriae TaxID=59893 RepID=A0A7H0Y365_9BACL|nr:hypothetical protein [Paenibacillus peoriae]QNR65523.1 hypothetical protein IAQ67_16710 [Paenibacillus peoriae]